VLGSLNHSVGELGTIHYFKLDSLYLSVKLLSLHLHRVLLQSDIRNAFDYRNAILGEQSQANQPQQCGRLWINRQVQLSINLAPMSLSQTFNSNGFYQRLVLLNVI